MTLHLGDKLHLKIAKIFQNKLSLEEYHECQICGMMILRYFVKLDQKWSFWDWPLVMQVSINVDIWKGNKLFILVGVVGRIFLSKDVFLEN